MAFNNHSNLKAAVQDWSHREDITSRIDDFILLAEQEMYNNRVEPLEVREQEFRLDVDTNASSKFLALPARFTSMRRLMLDDKTTEADQIELQFYPPEVLPTSSRVGRPSYFTVTDQIEFDRVPDAIYNIEFQYFATIPPLTAAAPTNSILTNYPSIYLAGTLWALHTWAKDPESAAGAYTTFIGAIKGANLADKRGRYGPAPVMRNERPVV